MSDFVRLRKSWEFDQIFRTGVRVNGELVRLLYLKNNDTHEIKFAPAVGKRLGKAHLRNRGKRILRAAFRQLSEQKKIIPGVSLVFTLKEKGIGAKTQDICEELERLLARKNLIKKL